MFFDVDSEPFGAISYTEGDPALAQGHRDHQRPGSGEAIGHQNSLKLSQDQGKSSAFGQNGASWMGGDQRSACEDAGQKSTDCAADAMDCKGVEGVVKTQSHFELN